jgi:YD repeat-containing protein
MTKNKSHRDVTRMNLTQAAWQTAIKVVNWTKFVIVLIFIFTVSLAMAQVTSSMEDPSTTFGREQHGLRGPVKSCVRESTFPRRTDAEGKSFPEIRSAHRTEYDAAGRTLSTHSENSDGSQWVMRYSYDPSGKLLNIASGIEGQATQNTTYSYDHSGRPQAISDSNKPDGPVTFSYDERGRKTRVAISRPEDYRAGVAEAASAFELAVRGPNLPGGGSATTIYGEDDRATEVQVRDVSGEVVSRSMRTYDAQGRVLEEKQILDNPEMMFPAEMRAQMLEQSGLPPDELWQGLRTQLTKLMAGESGPYSISYSYDSHGRLSHVERRIFNMRQEIETTYNEHGDVASEITRSAQAVGEADPNTPSAGLPEYSEVSYSYKYDDHENWIEQSISYRSSPGAPFQSSTVIKRSLTYY